LQEVVITAEAPSFNPHLTKWDLRFIDRAEQISTWSKDPKKQVGCVLSLGKRVISEGYNGFPEGLSDNLSRLKSPSFKDRVILHAEANAIINAGKFGVATEGATAYVTYHPCARCASILIQAGIKKIICPSPHLAASKWKEDFDISSDILVEAGVLTLYYN
jgi:dCMP deaminase